MQRIGEPNPAQNPTENSRKLAKLEANFELLGYILHGRFARLQVTVSTIAPRICDNDEEEVKQLSRERNRDEIENERRPSRAARSGRSEKSGASAVEPSVRPLAASLPMEG